MPDLDEFLKHELRRTVRPVDVNDVSSRFDVRRTRRARARKVQAAALAVVVIAATLGGVAVLSSIRKGPRDLVGNASPASIVPKVNGVIVAAQRSGDAPVALVSVNPDGSQRQVIHTHVAGDPSFPAWSPDGTKLAVAVFPPTGLGDLWVMDADGSNPRKIAQAAGLSRPSWSPDGTGIAYVAYDATADVGSSIHIASANGSDDRIVGETAAGPEYLSAAFSPDGQEILYARSTDSGANIFVTNLDGSDVRQLTTTGSDFGPSYSPDGRRIVFTRRGDASTLAIYVMDVDGSNVTQLTNGGVSDADISGAEWSPDGEQISYIEGANAGPGSLVVMNADGSHPVTILNDGVVGVAWQPLPITATPAPAVADLGLGFPVCDPHTIQGDFDGDGELDTASVATKMSDVGGCLQQDQTSVVLAIDTTGDGSADTSYGPLVCDPWCIPFAAPDVNGDGRAELVMDEGHLASPASAQLAIYELTTSGAIVPVTFPNGDHRFDWAVESAGTHVAKAFCAETPTGRTFNIWTARSDDGGATFDRDVRVFDLFSAAGGEEWKLSLLHERRDPPSADPFPSDTRDGAPLCGVPTAITG